MRVVLCGCVYFVIKGLGERIVFLGGCVIISFENYKGTPLRFCLGMVIYIIKSSCILNASLNASFGKDEFSWA